MGNIDVINKLVDWVPSINFNKSVGDISLFETTIRYLGGLLSAYDLLNGPLKQYARSADSTKKILAQAEHLAQNLVVAFDTPTGIPDNDLKPTTPFTRNGSVSNGIATIGTLVLEWTRLSDLTGNPLYGQLAQRGESYLLSPQPASSEPFPGLIGTNVDIKTGQFRDSYGGWVGGDDSFYEYLIKMYLYDPTRFASYKDRWVLAVESSIKYLASQPSSRPDLTFLAMFNGQSLLFVSQHRECPHVCLFHLPVCACLCACACACVCVFVCPPFFFFPDNVPIVPLTGASQTKAHTAHTTHHSGLLRRRQHHPGRPDAQRAAIHRLWH